MFPLLLSSDKKQKSKIIPLPPKKNFKREINIEVFRIIERFSIITQWENKLVYYKMYI